MPRKNTAHLWDKVWDDPHISKANALILQSEAATILWSRIKDSVVSNFGNFKKLSVIEIGAGTGTYAALMAKMGAQVTVFDYSPKALQRARDFFKENKLHATFVQGDAFNLPKVIKDKKFDISISIGLTEHFKGKRRIEIHKIHLDVLKKGGLSFISVPNKNNIPYRIFKLVSEITKTWKFGEEYPFSRKELQTICKKVNGEYVTILGDELYKSIKFLLPANFLRRFFRVGSPRCSEEIREERGSVLDQFLGYSLVLVMRKI